MFWKNRNFLSSFILCLALLALSKGAHAQVLEDKLAQQTDYFPQAAPPVDQLIEVAQRFKIPMAIEWLERAQSASGQVSAPTAMGQRRTIRDLLRAIVEQSPEHQFVVEGGLLHVFAPAVMSHHFNFLNIQISSFHVESANLFQAEASLRTRIITVCACIGTTEVNEFQVESKVFSANANANRNNIALYPKLFENGYGGGYGYPPDHVFTIPNVTVSAENLNIRGVLNRIAESSGNALWVVRLKPDEFTSRHPHWQGKAIDKYGHSPVNSRWRFLPLAEVSDLAVEQVVIELAVEGFTQLEKVMIPILPEHGLSSNERGQTKVSAADSSFGHVIEVEKVRRDAVTLKITFSIKHLNEPEKSMEETITVVRGKPTELRLYEVGRLTAYIEARHN